MTDQRSRLADRRMAVGLSQEEVAEAVGVSVTSYARWERDINEPKARYRPVLAAQLQVTTLELDRLLKAQPPADDGDGHAVPAWMTLYESLEQAASRLQTFQPITIPGLLQTSAYAEAVLRDHFWARSHDQVRELVEARLRRQAALSRPRGPMELCCVIDESTLHRITGGPAVMAAQLDHLAAMAARPTIRLQIFPAAGTAVHIAWFGAFELFTGEGAATPFVGCSDTVDGVHYHDNPEQIGIYVELFEHLSTTALSEAASVEMLRATAEEYR